MRVCIRLIIVCIALAGATGCAQRDVAVTAQTTAAELPDFSALEPIQQANVAVEGQAHASRLHWVPEFKEPELTDEERAALGEDMSDFKFLLYDLGPVPNTGVGPWWGGVEAHAHGRGGVEARSAWPTSVAGVAGWGGASTGAIPGDYRRAGVYDAREPRPPVTGAAGPTVATDRARRVADHQTRRVE